MSGGTGRNVYPVPGISPGGPMTPLRQRELDPDAGNDRVAAVFERGAAPGRSGRPCGGV